MLSDAKVYLCESCDNPYPLVPEVMLCPACCFGEGATLTEALEAGGAGYLWTSASMKALGAQPEGERDE